MTKEQLLMPRYLCTGTPGKPLWPGYHHKHGDIITNVSQVWINAMANEAPHLFKPLQWWEYRKPEEMPEWVRFNEEYGGIKKGGVRPVTEWRLNNIYGFICDTFPIVVKVEKLSPATREEYEEYLKQKEVK